MKRQAGQALPLGLFLLLAAVAVTFLMFNGGQLVQEKMRLTTTADAVAYSAGVFEARVLNYDAYANRAMIVNEIAIGQAVSIASWSAYIRKTAENLHRYDGIPFVAYFTSAFDEATVPLEYVPEVASLSIWAHELAIEALATSQYVMHGTGNATALASRLSVMREIAQRNDPDATVDPAPITDDFADFTERYETRAQRARMGRLVSDGRDAFTVQRNWDIEDLIGFDPKLRLFGCDVGDDINKRGATELIDLVDGWKGMDTLSHHMYSIRWRWGRPRCRHAENPIGYASAATNDDLDDSGYDYQGARSLNSSASREADRNVADGFEVWSGSEETGPGRIPEYYELAERVLEERGEDPRTTFAVRVHKAKGAQRYSGGASVVKPTGQLDLYDGAQQGGVMAALSKVEIYFKRSGVNALFGRVEYGSLFNPYWQVRLVGPTSAERAEASSRQGSSGLPD